MRRPIVRVAAIGFLLLSACSDGGEDVLAPPEPAATIGASVAVVTNGEDSGAGSFRAALELANLDPAIRAIRFRPGIGTVRTASTLTYTGAQSLRIEGGGATLDASGAQGGAHALVANGGGDLTLHRFGIEHADGNGLLVEVPADRRGFFTVALLDVTLNDNGLSGLYLDDQAGGSNPGGGDSDASIVLLMTRSRIANNGFRPDVFDFDGVRVDEGGHGALIAVIVGSGFTGNAGDGIELDETGNGDVDAYVRSAHFDENGTQPQNPDDLEDGFDIDENDAGSIVARLVHVTANGNQDEGIDLDEEGSGDIGAWFTHVVARGNADSNITFTEDEIGLVGGDIGFVFTNVTADESEDDDGFKAEEFGAGNVSGLIVASSFSRNDDDGLQIEQNGAGTGNLRLVRVTTDDNGDDAVNTDGVTVR
jgi:hypothetical protein